MYLCEYPPNLTPPLPSHPCSAQNSSRKRQTNLEKLQDFVSRATQELIWLNEKEEEEVAFDWSDRNSNIDNKRDYHAVSHRDPPRRIL